MIFLMMICLEFVHYPNYFFSTYHLVPGNFFLVLIFSVILLLPSMSSLWLLSKDAFRDFLFLITRLISLKNRKVVLLAVLPILLLLTSLSIKHWAGPYWLGSNSDPEYAYLLSSLSMTQFKRVVYTDHPGTPLQILGAGTLAATHTFRPGKTLVMDVLSNPELYLSIESYFLIFFIALSLFLIGVFTTSLTRSLLYGVIMQLTPFLSTTLLSVLNRVSPEPLLILAGLWYSFSILYLYYLRQKYKVRHVVIMAIISGLLVATKINAIPLLILPIILFPSRMKISYLFSTFLSFIIFTLPIYNSYINFARWVYRLFIHTGIYGTGTSTIIDLNVFWENIKIILFSKNLFLVLILGFTIVLILFFRNKRIHHWYEFLLGLTLVFIADILVVAKHFDFHYLVPAFSILGVSIVIFLSIFDVNRNHGYSISKNIVIFFIFIFAAYNFASILNSTKGISGEYIETLKIDNLIAKNYYNYIKVTYYRSSAQDYALSFGNIFAANDYDVPLSELYPNSTFYDIWGKTFYNWNGSIEIPKKSKILLRGGPGNIDLKFTSDMTLKEVYRGKTESLYTLNYNYDDID